MSRGGCWGSASSCTEGARGVCRKDGYDPLDSSSAEDVAMSGISSRTLSLRSLPQLPGEGDSGPMEVHTGEVTWAGWSPAEPSLLASTSYDGTVCAVSVDEHTGATVKWHVDVSDELLVNGAWSADGARIACTCTGKGEMVVVDAAADPPRVEWKDKHLVGKRDVMPTALGWCPRPGAPEQLAIGSSDGAVRLVDVQNQTQLWKIDDEHTDEVRGLAWSADGDRLASVSADETLRVGVLKGAAIDSSALIRLILEREAAQLPDDVAAQLEELSDAKLRKIALKLEVSPSHTPD
jgi:WD40 repeat protein